jgi:hypothetical protein
MRRTIATLLTGVLLIVACGPDSYRVIGKYDPTQQSFNGVVVQNKDDAGCQLPPSTFEKSDLVGTWNMVSGSVGGTMTLTLKTDGTYQQVYDYPLGDYHYTSEWLKWWLQPHDNGIPLLHLEGMRWCTYMCFTGGGTWYDFCNGEMITFNDDEVMLLVTGVSTEEKTTPFPGFVPPPRGIQLIGLKGDPDSSVPVFEIRP